MHAEAYLKLHLRLHPQKRAQQSSLRKCSRLLLAHSFSRQAVPRSIAALSPRKDTHPPSPNDTFRHHSVYHSVYRASRARSRSAHATRRPHRARSPRRPDANAAQHADALLSATRIRSTALRTAGLPHQSEMEFGDGHVLYLLLAELPIGSALPTSRLHRDDRPLATPSVFE